MQTSSPALHFLPFHFHKSFSNRSDLREGKKKRVLDKNMRYKSGLIIDHADHAKQGPNMKGWNKKKTACAFKMGGKKKSYTALCLWF